MVSPQHESSRMLSNALKLILYFGDVASLLGKEASQTGSSVLTDDPMEAALLVTVIELFLISKSLSPKRKNMKSAPWQSRSYP